MALTTSQAAALTTDHIQALSKSQITAFETADLNSLTSDEIVALTTAQAVVLSRARELGRAVYGEAYVNARNMAVLEVYMPVQQGRTSLGAIVAVYSI